MDLKFKGPFGTQLQVKGADGGTVIGALIITWCGIIALALLLH